MSGVVVIDDDEVYGELICSQLAMGGVEAVFHQGWHRSSVALKQHAPGVVMIDVNMPGMPGTNLIAALRKLISPMPRIILMSSMDVVDLEQLGQQFGADAVLSKSADRDFVIRLVREHLAHPSSAPT